MNNDDSIRKMKEIYFNFKLKLGDIMSRKKLLLRTYRSKIEEAKIKEVKESLKNLSK